MAALVMQVNGFQFQCTLYIALDEGSDYYHIYGEKDGTTKEYHHDVAPDFVIAYPKNLRQRV